MLIESRFPDIQLKFKWHLPFYYLDDKTMFCFFNFRKEFVDLGMPYGIHLTRQVDQLVGGEQRKMLRSLRFDRLETIDDQVVLDCLEELEQIRLTPKLSSHE